MLEWNCGNLTPGHESQIELLVHLPGEKFLMWNETIHWSHVHATPVY